MGSAIIVIVVIANALIKYQLSRYQTKKEKKNLTRD
jgi:hypothetical protein